MGSVEAVGIDQTFGEGRWLSDKRVVRFLLWDFQNRTILVPSFATSLRYMISFK